jgi:hypothetical protein
MTRVRDIAKILGVTEAANPTNAVLTSTADGSGGVTVYATKEDLPSSGLTSGDQAYVTANSRFYISNGSGWYNVALINATPSLTIDPTGAIELSTEGATTTITLTATDSDNAVAGLTYSVESDGSFGGMATISQDSSVFTITPLSEDSATTETSTLTFKASDGISFGSGQRTFTLTFISIVENSAKTTLLLKNEETSDNQVDASTNALTITEYGNVTSTALSPYHPGGYSTYFDGSGDYLAIYGASTGVGTWTLEGWFYFNTLVSTRALFSQGTVDNTGGFIVWSDSNGIITFYSNGEIAQTSSGAVNANEWAHIAIVSSSNSITIFVNGVSVGTGSYSGSGTWFPKTFTNSPLQINRGYGGVTEGNNCYIADVRLVNNTAVYTSNFTPPTERLTAIANTSLLTCHLPYMADGSTNGRTITVNGNAVTKRFGPYDHDPYTKAEFGGSVYFDGNGDYLTVGSASDGGLSGTFTIEFWMYLTSDYANQTATIVSNYDGAATNWAVQQRSGGEMWLTTAIGTPLSYTLNPKTNTWYHIAFSNNSSSSTGKLFVNGIEVDNHTGDLYNSTHMAASAQPITIGRLGNNTSQDFPGYISDLRIIDGTMLYTSNFTPPTAPLTAITNTKLLTCTNKNDIWDASGNQITKVGNVTGGGNSGTLLFGQTSVYFGGTSAVENTIDAIGDGDFTFEGWLNINADTAGNYQMVFDNRSALTTGPYLFYYEVDDKLYAYLDNTAFTSNNAISQNTWYHWALVRNNNACTFYLNGTAQTTNAGTSITTNFTGTEFNIGRSSSVGSPANGDYFIGHQQDLRITKGLARYTGNFTPPTAEFDG